MPSITYWHRLEPRPRSSDLAEALSARIRDPAWLLARQWQLGEFRGEDAASPAYMKVTTDKAKVLFWGVGSTATQVDPAVPLERIALEEPFSEDDLAMRVE